MSTKKSGKSSDEKEASSVLTVRIDKKLDTILEEMRRKRGLTKANVIRNYLDLVKFFNVSHNSIRSLDERPLIIMKREDFKNIINQNLNEIGQMQWGITLARFINDIARSKKQLDDIEYKLDLCEKFGFFRKYIDDENYIWFQKEMGPEKLVEAFAYKLINFSPEVEYNLDFTTEKLADSKSKTLRDYKKIINPQNRNVAYYAFEFAKLERE